MIPRLPRWAWPVAWLLAFAAGAVNAVGLLGVAHRAVSHLTGTTTLLAAALAGAEPVSTIALSGVAAAFVLGAATAGALVPREPLRLGHRQSLVLAGVAALLGAAWWSFGRWPEAGLMLAAAACGLQNAMTTAYSGAVARTSHVSGMFTDFGLALGRASRGEAIDRRRLSMCGVVITGFFAGGLVAAVLFPRHGVAVLALPIAVTAALAAGNAVHVGRGRGG